MFSNSFLGLVTDIVNQKIIIFVFGFEKGNQNSIPKIGETNNTNSSLTTLVLICCNSGKLGQLHYKLPAQGDTQDHDVLLIEMRAH